jgi:hypothetical protein
VFILEKSYEFIDVLDLMDRPSLDISCIRLLSLLKLCRERVSKFLWGFVDEEWRLFGVDGGMEILWGSLFPILSRSAFKCPFMFAVIGVPSASRVSGLGCWGENRFWVVLWGFEGKF